MPEAAIALLHPVVNQITEGRETLDYVYAVTLLETLRDHRADETRNPEPRTELGIEPGTQEPGTSEPVSF